MLRAPQKPQLFLSSHPSSHLLFLPTTSLQTSPFSISATLNSLGPGPLQRSYAFLLPFLCLQRTANSFTPASPSSHIWGPWNSREPIHPLTPSGVEICYSIRSGGCNQTCLSWQFPVSCMALGCHPLTSSWMYSSYGLLYIPVPLQRDLHAAPGLQSSAGRRIARQELPCAAGRAQLTGGQRRFATGH